MELFKWLASVCPRHDVVWDCACGSGQASGSLVTFFDWVVGTDASLSQIALAEATVTSQFAVAASEQAPLRNGTVDLVAVGAALHWFAGEPFFAEVRRVLRPGGIFAAWSYGMPKIDSDEVARAVYGFIDGLLGPFWPPEIRMVLDGYASISLPFEELESPAFELKTKWPLERFLGFARTWSAVGRYVEDRGEDPVLTLAAELEEVWPDAEALLPVSYRLDLRAGRV
jgi:SAM-dependent methyltransferase